MQNLFPLILPDIPVPEKWAPLLKASYEANHFSNTGPLVNSFEERINRLFEYKRSALSCSNATAGLQIVLNTLTTTKKKVIVPSFTFAATAHAVICAGFEPFFVDISSVTSELDIEQVEEALANNDDIAAVMYVRSFGYANDLSDLNSICERYGAPLIVDSASGFGGRLNNGELLGHQGIAEVFSFHATKTFSIGEGGLITGDKEVIERARLSANFGINNDGRIQGKATNAKMSEFHAAIAHAALDNFENILNTRQKNASDYTSIFSNLPVKLPRGSQSLAWQFYPVYLKHGKNQDLVEYAQTKGFLFRAYYSPALHKQEAFSKYNTHGNMKHTNEAAMRYLSLPIHREVTTETIEEIYNIFENFINKKQKAELRCDKEKSIYL